MMFGARLTWGLGGALAALALVGCAPSQEAKPAQEANPAAQAAAPFAAAGGETFELAPLTLDEAGKLGAALGVVKLTEVGNQTEAAAVRLLGIGGSDPAANGLKTYLSFSTPHDGKAFAIGDFLDYRLISASSGRVDLEIDETTVGADGNLGQHTKRVIISWSPMPVQDDVNPTFPASVTITPAK
jgi:hypothetical protein